MDGWKTILSFWGPAYFQVRLLLVLGTVEWVGHSRSVKIIYLFWFPGTLFFLEFQGPPSTWDPHFPRWTWGWRTYTYQPSWNPLVQAVFWQDSRGEVHDVWEHVVLKRLISDLWFSLVIRLSHSQVKTRFLPSPNHLSFTFPRAISQHFRPKFPKTSQQWLLRCWKSWNPVVSTTWRHASRHWSGCSQCSPCRPEVPFQAENSPKISSLQIRGPK